MFPMNLKRTRFDDECTIKNPDQLKELNLALKRKNNLFFTF